MRFLLTGASGFLGKRLIERLSKEGHEVFVLARRQPDDLAGATFVKGDITDKQQLAEAAQASGQIDAVIHLAANVPKTKDEDVASAMCEVNVVGTVNVLEAFGPITKNFVYASTAEVYGLPETNEPISEQLTPQPLSYYGASKLAGELFCRVYGQRNNLPVSMLRFSVMYGPGDTINRAIPNFINKALAGENLEVFGGEEVRDYLHLDDAVRALQLAATRAQAGVFNIGTGHGVAIKDVAEMIISKVNPKLKASVLPREKKAADIVLDISKAKQELGFEPKTIFPDKLEEQIEWHRNQR